jgi:phage protein D
VPQPDFSLTYTGTDITADVRPFTVSVSLTDNLEGKSDECQISLENRDLRWLNDWLPGEADRISLALGYKDALGTAVEFEIDEVSFEGVPDTITLSGVATPITAALRQRNAVAYENTTLAAIAKKIADKHKLELVGSLPNIKFKRVTQKHETDLAFLRRIALDYGIVFKVESLTKLVFFRVTELESAEPVLDLNRVGLGTRYQIKRQAAGTYKQANVSYQNPATGEFIDVTVGLDGKEIPKPKDNEEGLIASEDELRISERVESLAIAKVRAVEELKRANQSRLTISATVPGNTLLAAGVCFRLIGFFKADGKYLIETVKHNLARSGGYTSQLDARKINEAES